MGLGFESLILGFGMPSSVTATVVVRRRGGRLKDRPTDARTLPSSCED